MSPDTAEYLINTPLENVYLVMAFCMLRMVGVFFGFIAFGWGLGDNLTLKVGLGFTMSLPVMFGFVEQAVRLAEEATSLQLTFIAAKEYALGFGLGLLASTPFRAMQYAGGIIDAFRGESDSGLLSPDGSPIQTISYFYLVIGIYVFVALGGFWQLFKIAYETFAKWPIAGDLPTFYEGAAEIVLSSIAEALQLALIVAAPLMTILVGVELTLIIAAKVGRRFSLYNMSFLIKNLITITSLPVIAIVIVHLAERHLPQAILAIDTLERFFE